MEKKVDWVHIICAIGYFCMIIYSVNRPGDNYYRAYLINTAVLCLTNLFLGLGKSSFNGGAHV